MTDKAPVDEEVSIVIKSKTITYSGVITIRKAHAVLQMIAKDEAESPELLKGTADNE